MLGRVLSKVPLGKDGGKNREAELHTLHIQTSGIAVGFHSNFKNFPTHTQDHVMHSNEGKSIAYVPYADRLRKR